MIINIENKAAYYHAPKCASRTVLGWIALIKHPNLIKEHPEYFQESRKIGYPEIRSTLNFFPGTFHFLNDIPIVESNYRFCILRDPVSRFISAFTNRVLFHEKISLKSKEVFDIETFIDKFDYINANSKDISHHCLPQYYFYGDLNKFHRVYRSERINELKKDLEIMFNTSLPDLHLNQNENIKKPVLNQNQINWIKDRYSIDYDNYKDYYQ